MPRSPANEVAPVLVTVEPASTANPCATPSDGAVWATAARGAHRSATLPMRTARRSDSPFMQAPHVFKPARRVFTGGWSRAWARSTLFEGVATLPLTCGDREDS